MHPHLSHQWLRVGHRVTLHLRRYGSSDSSCRCFVEVYEPWKAGVETIVSNNMHQTTFFLEIILFVAFHHLHIICTSCVLSSGSLILIGTTHTTKSSSRLTKMYPLAAQTTTNTTSTLTIPLERSFLEKSRKN